MALHSHNNKGQPNGASARRDPAQALPHAGASCSVFLVDDEPVVRRGLRLLLDPKPGLEVCGEAASEHEAFDAIVSLQPDVAVVDLTLKEGDGMSLIRRLHRQCPTVKLLVFSMHEQAHFAAGAFAAGAHGYIVKGEGAEQLVEAIEIVQRGGCFLSQSIIEKAPGLLPRTGPHGRARGHSAE